MLLRTAYDISAEPFPWLFVLAGPGLGVLGLIALAFVGKVQRLSKTTVRWMQAGSLAFGLVWTVFAFVLSGLARAELIAALNSGTCVVVEGEVENFVPMPPEGHAVESFSVGGATFQYSDFQLDPGFRNSSSHGGPIRAGLYVRIHYLKLPGGNRIAKLEIQQ
jgi:hypothetical protein